MKNVLRIMVTGANSFLGRVLVGKALERQWQVTAVVRSDRQSVFLGKETPNLKLLEADIGEYDKLNRVASGLDYCVHLAWNGTRGNARNDIDLQASNYQNSLKAFGNFWEAGCGGIISAGSQAEYGVCEDTVISEDTPCHPNTAYGTYKLRLYEDASELSAKYNASYKQARFFSVYGPGDYSETLVMSCIRNMLRDAPCNLTECVQLWDYLYVTDAVEGILRLCNGDISDGAYNFAGGDVRPLKSYVDEIKAILNSKSALNYGARPYPPEGAVSFRASIRKARDELGWNPVTQFRDGILETARSVGFSQ